METEEVALCMIVKDEERLLAPLLDAVSPYVGEIIVVDTGSEDGTAELAATYATQVYYYPLTSDFSAARNYGQSQASKPWVLVLDADEWPTQSLLNWLENYRPSGKTVGVEIRRENRIDGELLPNKSAYEWHVRLYRRERPWVGALHEHVWVDDPATQVARAPEDALLLHDKPQVRQEAQNALYTRIAEDTRVYLNLGSGGRPIEGWVNIDVADLPGVDLRHDVEEGLPYPDMSVDAIWADQLLEHISYHTVSGVIGDWCRALKVGGTITIGTPDLRALCRAFTKNQLGYLRTVQLLYGGQTMPSDYHRTLVDRPWLEGQLRWWGCDAVKWLPGVWWNICVQADKVRHVPLGGEAVEVMVDPEKGRYHLCNTLRYFDPYDVKEDADKVLEEWDDVCNQLGILHILVAGTCLGFYRDDGYIEHDNDIDVAVVCSGSEYEAMTRLLVERGFYGRVHRGTNRPEDEHYFKYEVMLGIFHIPGGPPPWTCDAWEKGPYTFEALATISYNGREYNIIHPVEDYFEWAWGKDWRVPELRP